MSTSFVIPELNQDDILQYVKDSQSLYLDGYSKKDDAYIISIDNDQTQRQYAMHKSSKLSKLTGRKLDDFEIASKSSILLLNTKDTENAWFISYSTTVSNPEIILNMITDVLDKAYYSEHSNEYQTIAHADVSFEESLNRIFR